MDKTGLWKVKAEDGTIFGPAPLEKLIFWAKDGRLPSAGLITQDDKTWLPVSAFRELEMDWVAELEPGKFYGPVHKNAIREHITKGTIRQGTPLFTRFDKNSPSLDSIKAENDALKSQILTLKTTFEKRTDDLEKQLVSLETERNELLAKLETRDLEFDLERSTLKANASKLELDLARAQASTAKLTAEVKQKEAVSRTHAAEMARITELESELASLKSLLTQEQSSREETEAKYARALREAEVTLEATREEKAQIESSIRNHIIREETLRKLVSQITSVLGSLEEQNIQDAEAVIIE